MEPKITTAVQRGSGISKEDLREFIPPHEVIQSWQRDMNRYKYDQIVAASAINARWLPFSSEKEGIDPDIAFGHILALIKTTVTPAWFNSMCISYLVREWYKEEDIDKLLEMFPVKGEGPMDTLETVYGQLNCESKTIN